MQEAAEKPSLRQVLLQFENLGDNCEFGLVQRQAGAEPMGLLRFASPFVPIESRTGAVVDALERGFDGLGKTDTVQLKLEGRPARREFLVHESAYQLLHHTFVHEGEVDPEEFRLKQAQRLVFLRNKLMRDLAAGEKIWVWKSNLRLTYDDVRPLLDVLQRLGPNTLLWAATADPEHPAGMAERIECGLIKGYVDRFAPYHSALEISFENWYTVCHTAYALWKDARTRDEARTSSGGPDDSRRMSDLARPNVSSERFPPQESRLPILPHAVTIEQPSPTTASLPCIADAPNFDLLYTIPADVRTILDVGCGTGALGAAHRQINPQTRWLGIERDPNAAAIASRRLNAVACVDVELTPLPFRTPEALDCIIYGDTLQQLREPGKLLRTHVASLSRSGTVLVCVPNVEHWSLLFRLIKGRWNYDRSGLLDINHLRWFRLETIERTLRDAGLAIQETKPRIFDADKLEHFIMLLSPALQALGVAVHEYKARSAPLQYVLKATKATQFRTSESRAVPRPGIEIIELTRPPSTPAIR